MHVGSGSKKLPENKEKEAKHCKNDSSSSIQRLAKEQKKRTISEAEDGGKGIETIRQNETKQTKTGKKEQSQLSLIRSFQVGTSMSWSLKTTKNCRWTHHTASPPLHVKFTASLEVL